jgi:hypothetical protein
VSLGEEKDQFAISTTINGRSHKGNGAVLILSVYFTIEMAVEFQQRNTQDKKQQKKTKLSAIEREKIYASMIN